MTSNNITVTSYTFRYETQQRRKYNMIFCQSVLNCKFFITKLSVSSCTWLLCNMYPLKPVLLKHPLKKIKCGLHAFAAYMHVNHTIFSHYTVASLNSIKFVGSLLYTFLPVSGHNPEWTPSRMDTIPNGHHPEWTPSRMDTIPKGHNPEWAQSRMDTIPNGHHPEWTQSRMDTIPNEHLQLYSTLVFNSYCLVRFLLRRRGFKKKLILCMNLSDR